jgi:hypothetical protein
MATLLLPDSGTFRTANPVQLLFFKVKVKVTLRLAIYRQSVCLGAKPLETHDQICFFFFNWTLTVIVLMKHPLWREDGFVSYQYARPFIKCTYRTYSVIESFCFCIIGNSVSNTTSIVAWVSVAAGTCLPRRFLTAAVYFCLLKSVA